MDSLWPWLAIAGLGALHGLSPTGGWVLAAAWGLRSGNQGQAMRALLPIAAGHTASLGLVCAAVVWGLSMDRMGLQLLAGGLLALVAAAHLCSRLPRAVRTHAGHAGLALGAFVLSTLHGAGLMLVPAMAPLCLGDAPAGNGPLVTALAAVALHTAAMLAVTGLLAAGACRGFEISRRGTSPRSERSCPRPGGAASASPHRHR